MSQLQKLFVSLGAAVLGILAIYFMSRPGFQNISLLKNQLRDLTAQTEEVRNIASTLEGEKKTLESKYEQLNKLFPSSVPSTELLNLYVVEFQKKHKIQFQRFQPEVLKPTKQEVHDRIHVQASFLSDFETAEKYLKHVEQAGPFVAGKRISILPSETAAHQLEVKTSFLIYLARDSGGEAGRGPAQEMRKKDDKKREGGPVRFLLEEGEFKAPLSDEVGGAPIPRIDGLVGHEVIIKGELYQQGQTVSGWRIEKVDGTEGIVHFNRRGVVRKVKVSVE